jgi:hypothetical protein
LRRRKAHEDVSNLIAESQAEHRRRVVGPIYVMHTLKCSL